MTARILALANQKGGVGKTTTAINLGTALAAIGHRTLVIDVDPQGNASTGFGVGVAARRVTTYDVMIGDAPLRDAILRVEGVPTLEVAPSDQDLAGAEIQLSRADSRNFRLKNAIQEHLELHDDYAFILIDCPPSLNVLTVNALAAAHAVIVPLQCEFFAMEGLSQLTQTIDLVRGSLNPELEIQGVVLTMYDRRNRLSEDVANEVRQMFGPKVYETVIPRNVRLSEAPSFGKPALLYDFNCRGSQAYAELASELLRKRRQAEAA